MTIGRIALALALGLALTLAASGCGRRAQRASCDGPETQAAILSYFRQSLTETEEAFFVAAGPRLDRIAENSRAGRRSASCRARLQLDVGRAVVGPDAIVTELQAARYLVQTGFGPLVHFDYPTVQRGLPTRTEDTRLSWDLRYSARIDPVSRSLEVNVDSGEAIADYLGFYATLERQIRAGHRPAAGGDDADSASRPDGP